MMPSGQQNLVRPHKRTDSLAGMRRDDEARGALGKDFVDGDPVLERQFAHSLDDSEDVARAKKKRREETNITRSGQKEKQSGRAVLVVARMADVVASSWPA